MGNLARYNDGIKYLLVVIDVVSKYLWVQPLKSKKGLVVQKGLEEIFKRTERRPGKLQTDDGKEFIDKGVQRFLKDQNIIFFTIKSDKKAAIAERVVRTLKDKIYRYMQEKYTKRYVDVLQKLVISYNETYHKSIGMAPSEVNESNEGEVLRHLYGDLWSSGKREKVRYKKGDYVRLNKLKTTFRKGYMGNWTEESFEVAEVLRSSPRVLYKVKDLMGELVEGSFYKEELQVVKKDMNGYWRVEKILAEKIVRGRKKYFVKWDGYPESMNSWVEDIKGI